MLKWKKSKTPSTLSIKINLSHCFSNLKSKVLNFGKAQINHPNSLLLNLKSTIISKLIFNNFFFKFIKKIKNKLFIFSSPLSLQQTTTTYYLLTKKMDENAHTMDITPISTFWLKYHIKIMNILLNHIPWEPNMKHWHWYDMKHDMTQDTAIQHFLKI